MGPLSFMTLIGFYPHPLCYLRDTYGEFFTSLRGRGVCSEFTQGYEVADLPFQSLNRRIHLLTWRLSIPTSTDLIQRRDDLSVVIMHISCCSL
jgi:hypothetical protein